MLSRVLEPEVMDRPEEAREYDAMDHSAVNLRFVADFLAAHGPGRGGELLDVGTGPARLPIALCRADRHVRVLGVDLSGPMLDLARRNIAAASLTDRIRLARGDAKSLPFPDGRFEAVVSNTIIHHIPDPSPALTEMMRLVAPGGTLMVRDLARPEDESALDALVQLHAAFEPIPARNLFRDSLHAALTLDEVREIVRILGPAGRRGRHDLRPPLDLDLEPARSMTPTTTPEGGRTPRGGDDVAFPSLDGTALRARLWYPANPRAIVVIAHGLGEHGGSYSPDRRRAGPRPSASTSSPSTSEGAVGAAASEGSFAISTICRSTSSPLLTGWRPIDRSCPCSCSATPTAAWSRSRPCSIGAPISACPA